jgi:hypothetical protein
MAKPIKNRMAEIMIGLGILGMGLWYFLPYVIVLPEKGNEKFEQKVIKKMDSLYSEIQQLSKSSASTWMKDWIKFTTKKVEIKQQENYKELPMLTYTKKQANQIATSKLAGYVAFYRKLKFLYLVYYLPVLIGTILITGMLGTIRRMEITEQLLTFSENIQKLGYVGLFISFLGFYVVYGCCFELLLETKIKIPHSLTFGFWDFILGLCLYWVIGNMPYTQEPEKGR